MFKEWRMLGSCEHTGFRNIARLHILVIFMVDYSKLLRESKDMKFEALGSKQEIESNPYSCNYCPHDKHKYCEHEHCILDPEWLRNENIKNNLRKQLQEEKDYLQYGEGTVGYDRVEVYKNVLKLEKKLKNAEKR